MRVELVTLTPTAAHELLDRSALQPQRRLNPARVNALVTQIQRGQFRTTHQMIAIDSAGVLFDGMHRVTAIARAGLPVEIWIAYDADPSTFDVIDTGRARDTAAALTIDGFTNGGTLAAAARLVLMYEKIAGSTTRMSSELRFSVTTRDVLDFMESARGETLMSKIQPAYRIGIALGRRGMRNWLSAAMTMLEDVGAPDALVAPFMEKLETGAMLDPQSPILALRRWLASDTGYVNTNVSNRSMIGMAVTFKAWNYWVEGRTASMIGFKQGIERLPAPIAHQSGLELVAASRF